MGLTRHILLIDDSQALVTTLTEQFREESEFALVACASGKEGLAQARARAWDVILLDVRLPDQDGLEVCRNLRQNGAAQPIIMLTALGAESDSQAGLAAGASDYIVKPFKFALLLARLRAHLHYHARHDRARYQIGEFLFHPSKKQLTRARKKIPLTDKEADILHLFCRHNDETISRGALLAQVWGYKSGVSTHTLETHIYRLRQKLEANPSAPRRLLTDKGGYRLCV